MKQKIKTLTDVMAFATTVIASEHFFSTFLSSPVTVQTLYKNKEDQRIVSKNLYLAIASSLGFGFILSYQLKSWIPLLSAGAVSILYFAIYTKAMRGEL